MRYGLVVADWNGTCFQYPSEEQLNRKIGYRILDDAVAGLKRGKVWKAGDVVRLARAKSNTKEALAAYKEGSVPLAEVYAQFNRALRGKTAGYINDIVDEFAREEADKVDGRVLRPLNDVHSMTAVLSVAYGYGIRRLLEEAGFGDAADYIRANDLLVPATIPEGAVPVTLSRIMRFKDGADAALSMATNPVSRDDFRYSEPPGSLRTSGLTLRVYGDKANEMEAIFRETGHREESALYLGDTMDDAPVAEMLPAGHFGVPPLAVEREGEEAEAFRREMAGKGAEFLATEEEVRKFLGV